MKIKKDILELTFSGGEIRPDTIRASEAAEMISAYETALLSVISRDNPEINLEEVFISLIEIEDNSAHFRFKPTAKKIVIGAATLVNVAVSSNDIQSLPYKSVESLRSIWSFTNKKNCVAEITSSEEMPTAQIRPENEIKISEEFFYEGETTIYGRIERVGGATPKVRLRVDDEQVLYIDISENTAKKIAHCLYETIGVKGLAKWRKDNFELEDFKIEEVLDFQDQGIVSSISDLKKSIGEYWDDIKDPEDYLQKIRYQDA